VSFKRKHTKLLAKRFGSPDVQIQIFVHLADQNRLMKTTTNTQQSWKVLKRFGFYSSAWQRRPAQLIDVVFIKVTTPPMIQFSIILKIWFMV